MQKTEDRCRSQFSASLVTCAVLMPVEEKAFKTIIEEKSLLNRHVGH